MGSRIDGRHRELVHELEKIRDRGITRVDGRGALQSMDTLGLTEAVADALAAAEGSDDLPRWRKVRRLFEVALERPEAEPVRARLRLLYGLSGEHRGQLPSDLMRGLWETETRGILANNGSNQESLKRKFRRKNHEAKCCLADAICAISENIAEYGETQSGEVQSWRTQLWKEVRSRPREVAGAVLLMLGMGLSVMFAMGLGSDHGLASGTLAAIIGGIFGRKAPRLVFYPVVALVIVLLTITMMSASPPAAVDGQLCDFLVTAFFAGRISRWVKWPPGMSGSSAVYVPLAALLTSMFWCGFAIAAVARAGQGDVTSSAAWTAVTGFLIGSGLIAAGSVRPRKPPLLALGGKALRLARLRAARVRPPSVRLGLR
jgi:hypothetical protein